MGSASRLRRRSPRRPKQRGSADRLGPAVSPSLVLVRRSRLDRAPPRMRATRNNKSVAGWPCMADAGHAGFGKVENCLRGCADFCAGWPRRSALGAHSQSSSRPLGDDETSARRCDGFCAADVHRPFREFRLFRGPERDEFCRKYRCFLVAGELGFEPRLTESESAVLPLNYSPLK
jgi:hypothetical protein